MVKFIVNLEYDVSDYDADERQLMAQWFDSLIKDAEEEWNLTKVDGYIGFPPEDDNDKKD